MNTGISFQHIISKHRNVLGFNATLTQNMSFSQYTIQPNFLSHANSLATQYKNNQNADMWYSGMALYINSNTHGSETQ